MVYFCEICNYTTQYNSNLYAHNKSLKHKIAIKHLNNTFNIVEKSVDDKNNSESYFSCTYCFKEFRHDSSLYRHKKKCKDSATITDLKNKLLMMEKDCENALLSQELQMMKKLEKEKSEMLQTVMTNANVLLNKAHDNNKLTTEAMQNVSISAIKFANEKYRDAPVLRQIENFNINDFNAETAEDKKLLTETLIYNIKLKSLDKLLGEHILKLYKKEDPKDQSIHATDTARLNYIVKELIKTANDGESVWEVDKAGIKICTKIIKPLIDKCTSLLMDYQKELLDKIANGDFNKNGREDVFTIIKLLMDIDKGSLESDINKYIAPHFNIVKN